MIFVQKGMLEKIIKKVNRWTLEKFLFITIFNFIIIGLFLLRSAGYFEPFFLISVNFIVVTGLIVSIFLLNATYKVMYYIGLLFWLFAGLLLIFNLDTWAERTAVYSVEALFIGLVLQIFNVLKIKD